MSSEKSLLLCADLLENLASLVPPGHNCAQGHRILELKVVGEYVSRGHGRLDSVNPEAPGFVELRTAPHEAHALDGRENGFALSGEYIRLEGLENEKPYTAEQIAAAITKQSTIFTAEARNGGVHLIPRPIPQMFGTVRIGGEIVEGEQVFDPRGGNGKRPS